MYQVKQYYRPASPEEAAKLLQDNKKSRLIAGNMFLRMTSATIPAAIDLSACGLDYIRQGTGGELRLGAMCTLRRLEVDPLVRAHCGGMLSKAAGEIIGVQFRNLATLGASVFSKYGFSDVITPLLACGARVRLYFQGELSLEEFLSQPRRRDLLVEVILPAGRMTGSFSSFRNSKGDFSILNVAAARSEAGWRIAVGARPLCAALAVNAMEALNGSAAGPPEAGAIAAGELSFGSDMRAGAAYRRRLCRVMVERALVEISEVTG